MAEAAFAGLPAEFRSQLSDVVLEVEDFATPEQLESVDLDDRWQLSGLYQGEPLPDRSIWESGRMPPRIMALSRTVDRGMACNGGEDGRPRSPCRRARGGPPFRLQRRGHAPARRPDRLAGNQKARLGKEAGFWKLARPKGFEPLTPRFVVWCSIQLSYGRAWRAPHRQAPESWQSLNHPFSNNLRDSSISSGGFGSKSISCGLNQAISPPSRAATGLPTQAEL